ncbi:MAG: hypothetical protein JXA15_10675 [Spirochaetales bacterium]|nr:hypothetical protein [Spirochaetales bacterium]
MNRTANRPRRDPAFLSALGLAPVAIGSVCLSDAVALGGSVAFAMLVAATVAPFARRLVEKPFQRLATALVVAMAASIWSLGVRALAPGMWDRLNFWLSLAGANCLVLAAAGVSGDDEDLSRLPGRLVTALLFFLSALALGAARELLSTGSLLAPFAAAREIPPGVEGGTASLLRLAALPSGGFIVLGAGMALAKELKRRLRRNP